MPNIDKPPVALVTTWGSIKLSSAKTSLTFAAPAHPSCPHSGEADVANLLAWLRSNLSH